MKQKLSKLIKGETVLVISFVLAVVSCFLVVPSKEYINYIDFRVLAILFMLMAVIGGLRELGAFKRVAVFLLDKVKNVRQLMLVLVLICFFTSMLITNDVALITFVPFSIMVLKLADRQDKLIKLIVLETIASNLGSMLTPVGNPQNLYIFSNYNMALSEFISAILPYCLTSLILILVLILTDKSGSDSIYTLKIEKEEVGHLKLKIVYYCSLFALCLGVVIFGLDYKVVFIFVTILVTIMNYRLILKIDYSLLFTFIFFFVFIGNLGNIEAIRDGLTNIITGNEFGMSVLFSQVFSNMPATMLLSEFTTNSKALLVGVNVGGLGTLIASMASLISYKFYANEEGALKLKYLKKFTEVNLMFMFILVVIYYII